LALSLPPSAEGIPQQLAEAISSSSSSIHDATRIIMQSSCDAALVDLTGAPAPLVLQTVYSSGVCSTVMLELVQSRLAAVAAHSASAKHTLSQRLANTMHVLPPAPPNEVTEWAPLLRTHIAAAASSYALAFRAQAPRSITQSIFSLIARCCIEYLAILSSMCVSSGNYIVPALAAVGDVHSLLPNATFHVQHDELESLSPRDRALFLLSLGFSRERCSSPHLDFICITDCLQIVLPDDHDEQLAEWIARACVTLIISKPVELLPIVLQSLGRLLLLCASYCRDLLHQLVNCVVFAMMTLHAEAAAAPSSRGASACSDSR
jgi:hypothetical protein